MANVLKRDFGGVRRNDKFTIVPIGDIHIGAAGCDEDLLAETVEFIRTTRNAYWIGMGDYIDAINYTDPRFDPRTLAPWITVQNMSDLAGAQLERFLAIIAPIAKKCLCMLTGNHEDTIKKYYERDIYSEIVSRLKIAGGFPQDHQLKLDYYGWLRLSFHSKEEPKSGDGVRTTAIDFNLHHGFGGGKLAGSKALQMEKWLWTHGAEITIFGHTHNADSYRAAVEYLDLHGNVKIEERRGVYSGTYLTNYNGSGSTYAERKGYFPIGVGGVMIELHPHAHKRSDMVRVIT